MRDWVAAEPVQVGHGPRRAMSLVEVMVAVVLLATVFLTMLGALPVLADSQRRAASSTTATILALRTMEQARALELSQLRSFRAEATVPAVRNGAQCDQRFRVQVDVKSVSTHLKNVTVRVSGISERSRETVLETLILTDPVGGELL